MYTAEYAGRPLYDPRSDSLPALDQSCRLSVSEAGEYRFTLPAAHPLAGRLAVMDKGREVSLLEDGEELFRGRVVTAEQSMEGSWAYVCEGERAYLNDVLLDPYEAGSGGVPSEPSALFEWYLAAYNSAVPEAERIHAGRNEGWALSAAGWEAPSSSSRATVWSELKANLVDALGGFLLVRHEHGTRWLDWLADGTRECRQRIEFGANLTDFARTLDGSQVATCVKPWCASAETEGPEGDGAEVAVEDGPGYDTVAGVPDRPLEEGFWKIGDAVVDVAATEAHGRMEAELECAAGTPADEMVAQGLQWLKNRRVGDTVQVSAVDLHRVDPSADPIRLGDFVRVTSAPNGYDAYMLCSKLEVLPGKGDAEYTLGTSYDTLTGRQSARLAQLSRKLSQTTERAEAISQQAKDAAHAAEQAGQAAQDAQGAADAAQGAADAAQQMAGEAFERGQQAAQAAADAQASAESAGQRADAAQAAADAAGAKAQAAAESAGEAAGRADAAQDAADGAMERAEQAAARADGLAGDVSDVSAAVDGLSATVSGVSETATEALQAASSAQQDISGFRATVEQTYETKDDADAAIEHERLERQSAIEQSAGQILSTVAQTYATSQQVGEVSDGLADVAAAQVTLQSQVDQQADRISQAVASVESVGVDAQAAKAAADRAQEDAEAATKAASAAQAEAESARSDADAAGAKADAARLAAEEAGGAADGAAQQAAEAAGIAGGKADVVFGDSEPPASMRRSTTLWIDTSGGANTPMRWTGSEWQAVSDSAAIEAADAASDAKAAADAAQASADAARGAADQADARAQAAQSAADQAQADADAAGAKADAASEAVGGLADRVTAAETRIDQTSEQIALMATKRELADSLAGYWTAEQAQAAIELRAGEVETSVSGVSARVDGAEGEIEALSTSFSQTTESLTESISRKTAEIEGLQGSLEGLGGSLGELAGRVEEVEASFSRGMDAEGNPTLTLSTTANGLSAVLTNSDLGFFDGGQEVASVGGKAFNANDMRVSGQLSMGGYAWVPDASGDGLALVWMGE